jgi:hypothetical protein
MNTDDTQSPMRAVARNPDHFAAYLANVQRVLLTIGRDLETLQHETRIDLRSTHVQGDRWYHARMRALPVEKTLKDVLAHLEGLTRGLEKATYKRRAHAEEVNSLPGKRRAKELAKSKKRNRPVLPAGTENTGPVPNAPDSGYADPASIYDLGKRRPA